MRRRTSPGTAEASYRRFSPAIIILAFFLLFIPMIASARIVVISSEYAKTSPEDKKRILSAAQIQELEADLRAKMGLKSLAFNKEGELLYDSLETPQAGSGKLRRIITGAIDDTRNIFEIGNYSGFRNIHFAVTDAGTIDIDRHVTVYRVKLDFGDFRDMQRYSPKDVLKSYTLGITLFHEIDHKVSYDPDDPIPPSGVRPDKSSKGVRGVIENTNMVRRELSLPERRSDQHRGKKYRGIIATFRNTYQIAFVTSNGKRQQLRWRLRN